MLISNGVKNLKFLLVIIVLITSAITVNAVKAEDASSRLNGKILLQVEANGEAWYLNPVNKNRYYLGRPADAFDVMRRLGLGINNSDFDNFNGRAPIRLAGRILIKTEDLGMAYYVNPLDLRLHYLGRPDDAFLIMRSLGLGITNFNLAKITISPQSKPLPTAISREEISLELLAQGFASPVGLVSAKDSTGRRFVIDQTGLIRIIDKNNNLLTPPFLDLKSKLVALNSSYDERGLLGLAFHPDYKNNGRFFVYYSAPLRSGAPANWNHTSRISEFMVSPLNGNRADQSSERIILEIDKPQANHNGGQIVFGPDNLLYIPVGDGGGSGDAGLGHASGGNAQSLDTLLGKILRISVETSNAYGLPADNPFVNKAGRDEIYAYGFRNPFHISFDASGSRALIAADAGQNRYEEVDAVTRGGNYGWNIREGRHCFDPDNPNSSPLSCPAPGKTLIDPVLEYKNIAQTGGLGAAIIGGYVYRGNSIPKFQGKYLFGDWSKSFSSGDGTLFISQREGSNWPFAELKVQGRANGRLSAYLTGFGQDEDNELYVLTSGNAGPSGPSGKVYKINGSRTVVVKIRNFSFNPQTVRVAAGAKIRWENEDNVIHTVTAAGKFDSAGITSGGQFELALTAKGAYDYNCTPHPFMTGKIIVE